MTKFCLLALLSCSPVFSQLVNFAPTNMTSNTAPSPYVVTTTSSFSAGYNAFTGGTGSGWIAQTGASATLELDFGSGNSNLMLGYAIQVSSNLSRFPTAWTIQGSNDNSTWSTVDSETGITYWTAYLAETKYFLCSTRTTAYRYFRYVQTAGSDGTYTEINQFLFFGGSFTAPTFTSGRFSPTTMTSYNSNFPIVSDNNSTYPEATNGSYYLYSAGSGAGPLSIWVLNSVAGWQFLDTLYLPGVYLTSYSVTAGYGTNNARCPKTWTMQGSNDNATWTTLDTQSSQTAWSTSGETRTFTVSGAAAWRSFRLNITANNGDGSNTQLSKVGLFGSLTPSFVSTQLWPIVLQ